MNKNVKNGLSIMLSLILAFMMIVPSFAEESEPYEYFIQPDNDLYAAFLMQTSPSGIRNGEQVVLARAALIDELIAAGGYNVLFGAGVYHDGDALCSMWSLSAIGYDQNYVDICRFYSSVPYSGTMVDPRTGEILCFDCNDPVYPDLYGPLNIPGTRTEVVESPQEGQTHISSVNINDCLYMRSLSFIGQPECTFITAVNCPSIERVDVRKCDLKNITLQPMGYEQPLAISVIGDGSVGATFYRSEMTLGVDEDVPSIFLGWYVNGQRVSGLREFCYDGDGDIYACFAGDVNNDGDLNMNDAVNISRAAIGTRDVSADELAIYDANANGHIDVSDAVIVARLGLGL